MKVAGTARGASLGLNVVDGVNVSRMLTDIRPVSSEVTAISHDRTRVTLPASVRLSPSFPNPFNAVVTVPFTLPRETHVRISVLNVAGQTVRVLRDHVAAGGKHQVQWDGTDDLGRRMASGLYLIRLEAENIIRVQKIALMK